MSPADPVRRARAYLLRVAEPPAPAVSAFVSAYGPVAAAGLIRAGAVPGPVRAEVAARRADDQADDDLAARSALGARLVMPEDDEWPAWAFAGLAVAAARGVPWAVAPLALWVRGPARLDTPGAVAVVGARAATAYGRHVAGELAYDLAGQGHPVVSGAAYGIDGAAHRGALNAGGSTIAVLGCALGHGYPSGHAALLAHIAEHGAVVSEYPPGSRPARHRFLVRNRLIAALADGTVVVEAGARSGARNTAAAARALGRVVMAVPGPITSAMSHGCNQLLRDGEATAILGSTDVADSIGRLRPGPDHPTPTRPTDQLDPIELRVHEALRPRTPHDLARIARDAGVQLDQVRPALARLEHLRLAHHTPAGWRLAAPHPPRSPAPRGGP
ncbi:MAG TPA: DNA-processing protein DprA [Pseudonocardiaceae bacterium]